MQTISEEQAALVGGGSVGFLTGLGSAAGRGAARGAIGGIKGAVVGAALGGFDYAAVALYRQIR